jgi:hypothetical protein
MSRNFLADCLMVCILGTAFGWLLGLILDTCFGVRL